MGKAGSQPSKAASKYIYGFVSSVWVTSVTHDHLYLSRSFQELIHPRPLHLDTQEAKELRQGHASGSASTWQVRGANANSKKPRTQDERNHSVCLAYRSTAPFVEFLQQVLLILRSGPFLEPTPVLALSYHGTPLPRCKNNVPLLLSCVEMVSVSL